MTGFEELARSAGYELFDYQARFLAEVVDQPERTRACLYYRTGAGKTLTSLLAMKVRGHDEVLVIAPPSTQRAWVELGRDLGIRVDPVSHAKFRSARYQISRSRPMIADEFHLFGGQKGQGWRKLERVSRRLESDLIIMSATPNYNDAERVYCVQRILSPHAASGGYIQFLYENCRTEQDPFSMTPKVVGFKDYPDAAAFLADLPRVYHLPDERVVSIEEIEFAEDVPQEFLDYGLDRRDHRMMASAIEAAHVRRQLALLDDDGYIRGHVMTEVMDIVASARTLLVFSVHTRVALGLSASLFRLGLDNEVVLGSTPTDRKEEKIDRFRKGEVDILIGTATLATGTDGLDKVCDTLLIVDDTDDEAMRRQLIGRILPRGMDAPIDDKKIFRLLPS